MSADSVARSTTPWDATTDGCTQIGGVRPDTTFTTGELDTPRAQAWERAATRGLEFRCTIDPSLTLRVTISGDTILPSFDSVLVRADSSHDALQVLHREPGEAEMPLPFHTDVLRALDLDADGHRDLVVGKFWGATGNRGYDVWRYAPAIRRFVADSALSAMWNLEPIRGRPCVRTSSNSSARDDATGVYCLRDRRWTLDSLEQNTWMRERHAVTHDVFARRADSLVRVRSETRSDSL